MYLSALLVFSSVSQCLNLCCVRYVYICSDCMSICLATVVSHGTLFSNIPYRISGLWHTLTHQWCWPLAQIYLLSLPALFCIPDGWPLPSDNLTPVGDGRIGEREAGIYCPSLSALDSIAGSGHIPFVALPPTRQAPSSAEWPQQPHLLLLSFQPMSGSSFLLSLIFPVPWVKHQIQTPKQDQKKKRREREISSKGPTLYERHWERGGESPHCEGHMCWVCDAGPCVHRLSSWDAIGGWRVVSASWPERVCLEYDAP